MSAMSDGMEQTASAGLSDGFSGVEADVAATFSVSALVVQQNLERAAASSASASEPESPAVASTSASPAIPCEKRITRHGMLHNVNGKLNHTGWMLEPLLRYDRSRIKAGKMRLREWDRYLINDDEYALVLTMSNLGFLGGISVQMVNLVHPSSKAASIVVPLPGRRIALPGTSADGVATYSDRKGSFLCRAEGDRRRIVARFDGFVNGEALTIDALLDQEPSESLYNVLTWPGEENTFHYRRFAPAFRASGSFKVGRRVHGFSPTRSFGAFGWNRGLWPVEDSHVWAVAQGWQDGVGGNPTGSHKVGLQLMQGMDQTAATQNAFFLDGRVIKWGEVVFEASPTTKAEPGKAIADRCNLLGAWRFHDREGCINLQFAPAHDAAQGWDAKAFCLDRHQVFGTYSGTVVIDGSPFVIADLPGVILAERVRL